jgi:lipid A 3-O-deacylase
LSKQAHRFFQKKIVQVCLFLVVGSVVASEMKQKPWESSALSLETGILWETGVGTPISYRLMPTQFSWRSREIFGHEFKNGSRLVVRNRFGLIGTWVQQGPESFYLGLTASPSIEWWDKSGDWSLFGGAGGGGGWIDSQGVEGGQGQDLTFNWFIRGGVERVVGERTTVTAGVLYKHLSNGGQTDPNPSINALGFSIGISRSY